MEEFLFGDPTIANTIKMVLLSDPLFKRDWMNEQFLPLHQQRDLTHRRALTLLQLIGAAQQDGTVAEGVAGASAKRGAADTRKSGSRMITFIAPHAKITMGLHLLFAQVCESQGNKRDHGRFFPGSPQMLDGSVWGCFALTELSNGTNTAAMTLSAHRNPDGTFTLHSPRTAGVPLAAKVWVGNLGVYATHCVTAAKLDGALRWFLVEIRRRDSDSGDLRPTEGVEVGDLGYKLGWNPVDHGYIAFNQKRLPATALLQKEQSVQKAKGQQGGGGGALAALSGGRVFITADAVLNIFLASSIAIRYSSVRHLFGRYVLEFPLQQQRLFRHLAAGYVYQALSDHLSHIYNIRENPAEVHAISCGCKAVVTWRAYEAISQARLACGGHGFHAMSGLGQLRVFADPAQTYEGENYVIAQQLSRWLLGGREGHSRQAMRGDGVLARRAAYSVELLRKNPGNALLSVAACRCFIQALALHESRRRNSGAPRQLREPLRVMDSLFEADCVLSDAVVLEAGILSAQEYTELKVSLADKCAQVMPHWRLLVDGVAPPDDLMPSVLAKSDGEVYARIWDTFKTFRAKL